MYNFQITWYSIKFWMLLITHTKFKFKTKKEKTKTFTFQYYGEKKYFKDNISLERSLKRQCLWKDL